MTKSLIAPRSPDHSPTAGEAREFLQERLAYLGRVYASIAISFYVVGNLVSAGFEAFWQQLGHPTMWIVPAACTVYLAQWLLCRRGAISHGSAAGDRCRVDHPGGRAPLVDGVRDDAGRARGHVLHARAATRHIRSAHSRHRRAEQRSTHVRAGRGGGRAVRSDQSSLVRRSAGRRDVAAAYGAHGAVGAGRRRHCDARVTRDLRAQT